MKGRRIQRLLTLVSLLQSGRANTAATLAEECGVSRRTVFRDLELLRQADIGVTFSAERQSFVIESSVVLPATHFSITEALAVLALCYGLGDRSGIPFLAESAKAARKIESNLPQRVRDETRDLLKSIEVKLIQINPLNSKLSTYDALVRASARRRNVRIRYYDATARKEISTKLSPYRVLFFHRSWYAIGRSSLHRETRTFNIDRIRELTELDDSFRIRRGFSLKRYFGNAWRFIPGSGADHKVKARFSKTVARNVSEIRWHATQKTRFRKDGSLDFEATVSGIGEISWWLLGYGDQVEVLSPKPLRNLIKQRLKSAVEQYGTPNQRKTRKTAKASRKTTGGKTPIKKPTGKKRTSAKGTKVGKPTTPSKRRVTKKRSQRRRQE